MRSVVVGAAYKVGTVFETSLTVTAASLSTLKHSVPAIAGYSENRDHGNCDVGLTRDSFNGPRRNRVLTSPQRALDTLEPYGRLHLDVKRAKDLLPMDHGLIHKTSDPFVEIYVNDIHHSTSGWKAFTNNPQWDFSVVLDIFSPLTIVRVQIVDRDNLSSNDIIGFVEFVVGDVEPAGHLQGWFELRRRERLVGMSPQRLDRHMRCRDDEDPSLAAHHGHGSGAGHRRHRSKSPAARIGKVVRHSIRSLEHTLEHTVDMATGSPAKAARTRHAPAAKPSTSLVRAATTGSLERRTAPCCGRLPSDDSDTSEEEGTQSDTLGDHSSRHSHSRRLRLNGGEVYLAMWMEADPAAEWYAFCFPPPKFSFMADMELDVASLYTKIVDSINLFNGMSEKFLSVFAFFMSWRCWPLSFFVLIYWWLAWLWPPIFLPAAPLLLFVWLRLLCQEKWNKRVLWHSNVAPLDDEGFKLVAAFRDSGHMEAWLVRLLGSKGLATNDKKKLRELAGLTFRNAKPVMPFSDLVHLINGQPWIHKTGPRRCPEGHHLHPEGCTPEVPWVCMNHGGCQHRLTNKFKNSVLRYTCETCEIDICEPCVARRGDANSPNWAGFAAHLLPYPALALLTKIDSVIDEVHKTLDVTTDLLISLLPFTSNQEESKHAWHASLACLGAAVALVLLTQGLLRVPAHNVGAVCIVTGKALAVLALMLPLLVKTSLAVSLATHLRANKEHHRFQQRRLAGGCVTHWAFFKPDVSSPVTGLDP